jgi:hypothetical protein
MLKKETEDTRKCKDLLCSWTGRIDIVKMTILSENDLQIQCNSHYSSNGVPHRNRQINTKIHVEAIKTQIAETILSKKSNAGGIITPYFKLYYGTIKI